MTSMTSRNVSDQRSWSLRGGSPASPVQLVSSTLRSSSAAQAASLGTRNITNPLSPEMLPDALSYSNTRTSSLATQHLQFLIPSSALVDPSPNPKYQMI